MYGFYMNYKKILKIHFYINYTVCMGVSIGWIWGDKRWIKLKINLKVVLQSTVNTLKKTPNPKTNKQNGVGNSFSLMHLKLAALIKEIN